MKLIKELKRRAHNVALAVAGKEPPGPVALAPVKVELHQAKVETFAAGRFIEPIFDEFVKHEAVMEHHRRGLAAEIGRNLLEAGYIKEEIIERPHELGLRGYIMRLTVKVVKPEEG